MGRTPAGHLTFWPRVVERQGKDSHLKLKVPLDHYGCRFGDGVS